MAGDKFDEAVISYVRRVHSVLIGERTAEEIKYNVAAAYPEARNAVLEVKGRDLLTGLPRILQVTTAQASEAISDLVQAIIDEVRSVLEKTPRSWPAILPNGVLSSPAAARCSTVWISG